MESTTKIGAGSVETAAPDQTALAVMNGTAAVPINAPMAMDGSYVPAEAKMYVEFLKIAYGVGFGVELGCPQGALVLGKKDVLVGSKTPLTCIILAGRGFWREWKPYEAGSFPRDFKSEADARAVGMRTQNPPMGSGQPLRNCAPAVDLALLVEKPAAGTTSTAFTIVLGGKAYAPVKFTVDKGPYANIERDLDQLPRLDAAFRGVPPNQGRLNGFFVTLSTWPELRKRDNMVMVKLRLAPLAGPDGKPVRVPDSVLAEFVAIQHQIKTAAEQPAETVGGEATTDIPF